MLKEYQASNSLKVPEVNQPIRIALTGSTKSPSLGLTLSLFDKEESLKEARRELVFRGSLLPPFSLHHFLNEEE